MRLLLSKPTPIETVFARPRPEADISPRGRSWTKGIVIALRVVLDAAVERIREPNLPRIRLDHQSITLRGVEVDRADQGEAVDKERRAPSGDWVRLVDKTQM